MEALGLRRQRLTPRRRRPPKRRSPPLPHLESQRQRSRRSPAVPSSAPTSTRRAGLPPRGSTPSGSRSLRAALVSADSRHLRLAIDLGPWPTWLVTTPDQLQRLFDDVGSNTLGINFDPSYLAVVEIDPLGFLRRFVSRVCHAHLKDHLGRYPRWEHHIPGRGELDYVPLVRELAQHRFQGSLAIECFTNMPLSTACEVGYNTLSVALQQIPADRPSPR